MILKKCQSKLDCLIFEMLFIRELEPKLNKQRDSIRAKVFTYPFTFNFVSFASAFLLLFFRNFLVLLL